MSNKEISVYPYIKKKLKRKRSEKNGRYKTVVKSIKF